MPSSILKPVYAFYTRRYQTHPILTICTTNALLAGISDTLTQKYLAPTTVHTNDHDARQDLIQDIEHTLWHEPYQAQQKTNLVNIKAIGEQTLNEVKEPGIGVRDMGERYVMTSQDSLEPGKRATKETQDDLSVTTTTPLPLPLDVPRLGRFMFYNFSIAPLIHTWFVVLDKSFPVLTSNTPPLSTTHVGGGPSSKLIQTLTPGLKRMVADQTLFAPVGLVLLFSGLTALEGGGLKEIKEKLNKVRVNGRADHVVISDSTHPRGLCAHSSLDLYRYLEGKLHGLAIGPAHQLQVCVDCLRI